MSKVLSQAGSSLADVYDVVGSIAGIDQLITEEVQLTHDMATTIFSERMSSAILSTTTGTISQSTAFDIEIPALPATPFRVHGVQVMNSGTTTVARLANLMIAMRDQQNTNDMLIWVWDGNVSAQRIEANVRELLGRAANLASPLPTMGMGGDQPRTVPTMFIRGDTTAFGAGTLNLTVNTHISFSQLEGVSSVGLPIPSW